MVHFLISPRQWLLLTPMASFHETLGAPFFSPAVLIYSLPLTLQILKNSSESQLGAFEVVCCSLEYDSIIECIPILASPGTVSCFPQYPSFLVAAACSCLKNGIYLPAENFPPPLKPQVHVLNPAYWVASECGRGFLRLACPPT